MSLNCQPVKVFRDDACCLGVTTFAVASDTPSERQFEVGLMQKVDKTEAQAIMTSSEE